jgi:hypothetical protein
MKVGVRSSGVYPITTSPVRAKRNCNLSEDDLGASKGMSGYLQSKKVSVVIQVAISNVAAVPPGQVAEGEESVAGWHRHMAPEDTVSQTLVSIRVMQRKNQLESWHGPLGMACTSNRALLGSPVTK